MSGEQGVSDRLERVFREVFEDGTVVLTDNTAPADVRGWDSLGTVSLLYALEAEFGVEIADDEVARLDSVGTIRAYLTARVSV